MLIMFLISVCIPVLMLLDKINICSLSIIFAVIFFGLTSLLDLGINTENKVITQTSYEKIYNISNITGSRNFLVGTSIRNSKDGRIYFFYTKNKDDIYKLNVFKKANLSIRPSSTVELEKIIVTHISKNCLRDNIWGKFDKLISYNKPIWDIKKVNIMHKTTKYILLADKNSIQQITTK